MSDTPPCRLHFILARDAPVGVIFRRGPDRWVQLIKWHTDTDQFETGQWFHGRIYERRCDLSPSGEKLVYFAAKITPRTMESEATYAWTAISRPPYLTALALWPKGDCWNGGGLFETSRKLWLNHPDDHLVSLTDKEPRNLNIHNDGFIKGEDGTVQHRMLERDGWRLIKPWKGEVVGGKATEALLMNIDKVRPSELDWLKSLSPKRSYASGYVTYGSEIREKVGRDGRLSIITQEAVVGMQPFKLFSVRNGANGDRYPLSNIECADFDHSGRLVFVTSGKVYEGHIGSDGIERRELADFNANKPETLPAPAWATKW